VGVVGGGEGVRRKHDRILSHCCSTGQGGTLSTSSKETSTSDFCGLAKAQEGKLDGTEEVRGQHGGDRMGLSGFNPVSILQDTALKWGGSGWG
jgi:hypothetical protein